VFGNVHIITWIFINFILFVKDKALNSHSRLPLLSIFSEVSISFAQSHKPRDAGVRLRLKRDGTRAETRFRLSPKRMSPFKSAGTSVQSTAGSRVVRISGSNAVYTMFRGSVKSTGYPLHSPVSPSLPPSPPCVTVCHQVSTGLYQGRPRNSTGFTAFGKYVIT
jgi:hypothetical protein